MKVIDQLFISKCGLKSSGPNEPLSVLIPAETLQLMGLVL